MGRVLGVDFGDRRIGLALGDLSGTFARPLEVVEVSPDLFERVRSIIHEEDVEKIVLGLPLNMDGTVGPKARQALAFKARLEAECRLPVETWDERLTTMQAEDMLRAGGVSPSKRKGKVDKLAAQILLQTYLDRRRVVRDEAVEGDDPEDDDDPEDRDDNGDGEE